MIVGLRQGAGHFAHVGVQFALLAVAAFVHSWNVWLVCSVLIALISLWAWISVMRHRRAIADTPTSHIASAAQGYVELRGVGKPLAGEPLIARLSGIRCLWYSYTVEQRDGDSGWKRIESATSDASFILDDGTGQCVVDVDGAEIMTRHKETWTDGDYRNTEWTLLINDNTYALGEFRTLGIGDIQLSTKEDVSAVLAEWKKDRPALLKRFDLNGDGVIDLKEWGLARQAAKREVAKMHREARRAPALNTLRRPASGQLYLLSNYDPDRMARRYLWWSLFHPAVFFAALASLPMLWRHTM
jgi:hypothetical protein